MTQMASKNAMKPIAEMDKIRKQLKSLGDGWWVK
jgi:hypothetical protein